MGALVGFLAGAVMADLVGGLAEAVQRVEQLVHVVDPDVLLDGVVGVGVDGGLVHGDTTPYAWTISAQAGLRTVSAGD